MNVYIEYVILDNFMVTLLISIVTYKIMHKFIVKPRVLSASLIGTIGAVFYPFINHKVFLFIFKFCLGGVLCFVLFFKKDKFVVSSLLFLLVTFAFGGCIFAANYFYTDNIIFGMTLNFSEIPIGLVVACVAIIYLIIKTIAIKIHRIKDVRQLMYKFNIKIMGSELNLDGMMDTGNRLYDKKSGLPVIILNAKCLNGILSNDDFKLLYSGKGDMMQKDAHYINYGTIAGRNNKILIIKPDKFLLYFEDKANILYDVMVGISFSFIKDAAHYDAILHPSLL